LEFWLTQAIDDFYADEEPGAAEKCYEVLVDSLACWREHPEINTLYEQHEVVTAEELRMVPLEDVRLADGEPLELKAIADVVLRNRQSGDIVLGEYKAWADMRELDALMLDDQHRRYLYAWPEATGVYFVCVKRAGSRAKPDAGIRWVPRNDMAQKRAMQRLRAVAVAAATAKAVGEVPADMLPLQNFGFHCKRCDYRNVCALSAQGLEDAAMRMLETECVPDPGRAVREVGR
jgi:hypothetical protein